MNMTTRKINLAKRIVFKKQNEEKDQKSLRLVKMMSFMNPFLS